MRLMRTKPRKKLLACQRAPYIFLAPVLIVFAAFVIYPFIYSIILSFMEFDAGRYVFKGIENYLKLYKDKLFMTSLKNTAFYLILQVPITIVLAVTLGVLIENRFLKGKSFFRMSVFLPTVTALVAYSMIFRLIFADQYGILNYVLGLFGVEPVGWLTTAQGARLAIVIAIIWRWVGYNTVIVIAGLQGIPDVLYDAARVDGATAWQRFWYVTLPKLKPVILFIAITSTIGTLQLFDEPYTLTDGGPNNATISIAMYLYNTAFRYFKFGYSSTMSIVLMIIIGVLSLLEFKLSGGEDE